MSGAADSPTANPPPVLRFAPSPTGHLHLGHALSACINLDWARRLGGRLLIRIEDTDLARCREEFVDSILDTLEWLDVRSDGPILRQSEHFPIYQAAADRLSNMGLLYPCFATRQQIQAAAIPGHVDPDGALIYPGLCRNLARADVERLRSEGTPFAMRLDMKKAIATASGMMAGMALAAEMMDEEMQPSQRDLNPAIWGDVVIQRKESPASYHLAVVVDDARQGVTHVVRGRDLEAATAIHRLLQVLLGLPAPIYHHHRLLTDEHGRKLSKRDGDTSLASLRSRGVSPELIRREICRF